MVKKNSFNIFMATLSIFSSIVLSQSDGSGGYGSSDGSYDLTGAGDMPCQQPLPIFLLAIWLPITVTVAFFSIIYACYYKRNEKSILLRAIRKWNENENEHKENFKLDVPLKYHGLILVSFMGEPCYLNDIEIDHVRNITIGTGENKIGKFTSKGDFQIALPRFEQEYQSFFWDDDGHQIPYQRTLDSTLLRISNIDYDYPCYFGVCEISKVTGILLLTPFESLKKTEGETYFKKISSQMRLNDINWKSAACLLFLGIFSGASIAVSSTFSTNFSTNLFYLPDVDIHGKPIDTYVNCFIIILSILHLIFSNYGALDPLYRFSESLLSFLNFAAISLNIAFCAINFIISYWF